MAEEMHSLRRAIDSRYRTDHIVGRSPQMLDVFKTVARVAPGHSNVLILGESGTGKELVARTLHRQSDRRTHRFVPVNMASFAEGVLESELFGHRRGAFTGATSSREGLFQAAHLGTLFLDEIGDMSPALQAKMLRAIQEQRVRPIGADEEVDAKVRIVAATHRDLEAMVRAGTFREDLYFRLNVVTITLPPLRERLEDIPVLIDHFLRKYEQETGREAPVLSGEASRTLLGYPWPGNVRELENVIERAAQYATHGSIGLDCLPARVLGGEVRRDLPERFLPLEDVIEHHVRQVLEHTGGNVSAAARILRVSRRTLHRMAERRRKP